MYCRFPRRPSRPIFLRKFLHRVLNAVRIIPPNKTHLDFLFKKCEDGLMTLNLLLPLLVLTAGILLFLLFYIRKVRLDEESLQDKVLEESDLAKAIVASMGEGLLVLDK